MRVNSTVVQKELKEFIGSQQLINDATLMHMRDQYDINKLSRQVHDEFEIGIKRCLNRIATTLVVLSISVIINSILIGIILK